MILSFIVSKKWKSTRSNENINNKHATTWESIANSSI
jgi:hypothetical protein